MDPHKRLGINVGYESPIKDQKSIKSPKISFFGRAILSLLTKMILLDILGISQYFRKISRFKISSFYLGPNSLKFIHKSQDVAKENRTLVAHSASKLLSHPCWDKLVNLVLLNVQLTRNNSTVDIKEMSYI